jgi:serine/threonine protein kinase
VTGPQLGKGAYGVVYPVVNTKTNERAVLKLIKISEDDDSAEREIKSLTKLQADKAFPRK